MRSRAKLLELQGDDGGIAAQSLDRQNSVRADEAATGASGRVYEWASCDYGSRFGAGGVNEMQRFKTIQAPRHQNQASIPLPGAMVILHLAPSNTEILERLAQNAMKGSNSIAYLEK